MRAFYENAQKNGRGHIDLSPVSERSATDIARLIGKDVRGFKTTFEERQAAHIKKDHGADGLADHSMADSNDVARIQYVLDNYDSVADGGRTQAYWETAPNGRNRTARTVVFSKKVNGTYYIVEAAPVTNARSVYIVSAYMSDKNNAATPTHLPDANPPGFTADTDNAPSVATIDTTIPQPSNAVKSEEFSTSTDVNTVPTTRTVGSAA